jgi:hypothetical protein
LTSTTAHWWAVIGIEDYGLKGSNERNQVIGTVKRIRLFVKNFFFWENDAF